MMARIETDCDLVLKKVSGRLFFKCSSLARERLKVCRNVAAV